MACRSYRFLFIDMMWPWQYSNNYCQKVKTMKRMFHFLLVFTIVPAVLLSCTKDQPIKSPFTVKYEIIGAGTVVVNPFMPQPVYGRPSFFYTNEYGQLELARDTASKTVVFTTSERPLELELSTEVYLSSKGYITGYIIINDKIKASQTSTTIDMWGAAYLASIRVVYKVE